MRLRTIAAALLLPAMHAGDIQAQGPTPADIVLTNAKVFTSDTARPWAEAVAIRGDRIAAVGTTADILRLAGAATRRIDLGGRVVVPGFNDAHAHLGCRLSFGIPVRMSDDPFADPTFAEIADSLRAAVQRAPEGSWLLVTVGAAALGDARARRAALDSIAPRHPVRLGAFTGHGAVFNSPALHALGIRDSEPDPVGGRYERETGSSRITGYLEEYAGFAANRRLCGLAPESTLVAGLRTTGSDLARLGVTSIQTMTNELPPAILVRVFRDAAMPQRVRLIPTPMTTPTGRAAAEWDGLPIASGRPVEHSSGGSLTLSGVKWILDGTPVDRLGFNRFAYADRPGYHGALDFPPDTIRALLLEARARGDQPILHAEGDSTLAVLLTLLDATGGADAWRALRPRVEHGDEFPPDLRARASRLPLVVVQNPTHFADMPMWDARFGATHRAGYQPMVSLSAAGIPLAIGSDGPMNPFLNLMMAATHPNNTREAMTREAAVIAYTRGSAYAELAESAKGTIAPGMLADIAVLSQDIFAVPLQALPGTRSVLTMIGGRVVYDEMKPEIP